MAQTLHGEHNLVQFESNPLLKGLEFISPLYDAISKEKTIKIVYKSFKAREAAEHICFAYLLKEYRNRWFVIVRSQRNGALLTLALDRIVGFSVVDNIKFVKHKGESFDNFYNDTVGVTKNTGDKAAVVLLEVQAFHAPYLLTKPIHSSQEIVAQNENATILKLNVVLNYELEREILGFGDFVKVLSPRLLVRNIRKRVERMSAFYNKEQQPKKENNLI